MTSAVNVVQLSDTHFLEHGEVAEGGGGYDTDAAFDAVMEHLGDHAHIDMVAVTGDVADHGRPEQYRKAAEAFSRFDVPVNVCPGNHDFDAPFSANMGRPGVATSRVVEIGAWAFLFVDSSAGFMVRDESGLHVDPPGEERLHTNGQLGEREIARIMQLCASTTAEHIFVWLHHPPDVPVPMSHDEVHATEWHSILDDVPKIRGLGAGHTHIPDEYELKGRPVYVAPSLKNNFSLQPQEWLPPGYRSYRFHSDGAIDSDVHHVDDDERWPRRPYGRLLRSLFDGEITHGQLAEIIAERSARP